eukprot:scaffold234_cov19-Tisochrysis_lutea.AAC.3
MAGFYPSVLRIQNPPPTYIKVSDWKRTWMSMRNSKCFCWCLDCKAAISGSDSFEGSRWAFSSNMATALNVGLYR